MDDKFLDDLIQENEILTEQLDRSREYNEKIGALVIRMLKRIMDDARVLRHVPEQDIRDAEEQVALEDGDELVRKLGKR